MERVDPRSLPPFERVPGWPGRVYHGENMTFGHWGFEARATTHAHNHAQEEVWHVIEGEVRATVAGDSVIAGPGMAILVPPGVEHSVKALSGGFAIVADHPARRDFGG